MVDFYASFRNIGKTIIGLLFLVKWYRSNMKTDLSRSNSQRISVHNIDIYPLGSMCFADNATLN